MDGPAAPRITPAELRSALGRFATGVTIVGCADADGQHVGLTANSFNALSLEPPLVLWSLRRSSPSREAFDAARHFAINVLAEDQVELSRRFASSVGDKFAAGIWSSGLGGAPVLTGATAVLECELDRAQDAGDHRLYIGRVLRMTQATLPPLVFHGGHYHLLGEVL